MSLKFVSRVRRTKISNYGHMQYNPTIQWRRGPTLQDVAWTAFRLPRECDLVMFHDRVRVRFGLDVHIRTQIRREFSFIAFAALRIGKDVLEVASQGCTG
jgi:hypothetical protein